MKDGSKVKIVILAVITCLWMAVIFFFSSRDTDESTMDSNRVVTLIGRLFVRGFDEKSEQEKQEFVESISHIVRKCAHATEYAILAILSFVTISAAFSGKKSIMTRPIRIFTAWGWATVYACTDEIHQLFVPGRSGQITDVMIDSLGAFAGILFSLFVLWIAVRRTAWKQKKGLAAE